MPKCANIVLSTFAATITYVPIRRIIRNTLLALHVDRGVINARCPEDSPNNHRGHAVVSKDTTVKAGGARAREGKKPVFMTSDRVPETIEMSKPLAAGPEIPIS